MGNHAELIRYQEAGKSVVKRDRHSVHFDLGGGQQRAYFTIDPIHYGAAENQEIDTAWAADTGAWQWMMVQNRFNLHARSVLNSGPVIEWLDPTSAQYVQLQPLALNWVDNLTDSRQQITQPQAVAAVANDNVLYWANGYGTGRHFRYTSNPTRLIKHLVIDSASYLPSPTVSNPYLELEFILTQSSGVNLYCDGVAWDKTTKTNTANRIEFKLADGTLVWSFDAPGATDANGNGIAGIFQLRKQGANRYCTVRVSKTWLDSATFPIEIDPTFTDGYGGDVNTAKDTHIAGDSTFPDDAFGTSNIAYLNTSRKMLIEFDLSTIPASATCNSATCYLYVGQVGGTNKNWSFYEFASANSDWVEGSSQTDATQGQSTWKYKQQTSPTSGTAWAGSQGAETAGTDYINTAIGTGSYTANDPVGTEITSSWNTTVVKSWFGASNTNYGVLTNKQACSLCTSDHATTGYRPKLVVDYSGGVSAVNVNIPGSGDVVIV